MKIIKLIDEYGGFALLLEKLKEGGSGILGKDGPGGIGGPGKKGINRPAGGLHGGFPDDATPDLIKQQRKQAELEARAKAKAAQAERIKQEKTQAKEREMEAMRKRRREMIPEWAYTNDREKTIATELIDLTNANYDRLMSYGYKGSKINAGVSDRTREQLRLIAEYLKREGWDHIGGEPLQEEKVYKVHRNESYSYVEVDGTYEYPVTGETLRIQTVTTKAGLTQPFQPTAKEADAASFIRRQKPTDLLVILPKLID